MNVRGKDTTRCTVSDLPPPAADPPSPVAAAFFLPPEGAMFGKACMKRESPTLKMMCLVVVRPTMCLDDVEPAASAAAGISAIVARVPPWGLNDTGPFGWHHSLARTYLSDSREDDRVRRGVDDRRCARESRRRHRWRGVDAKKKGGKEGEEGEQNSPPLPLPTPAFSVVFFLVTTERGGGGVHVCFFACFFFLKFLFEFSKSAVRRSTTAGARLGMYGFASPMRSPKSASRSLTFHRTP